VEQRTGQERIMLNGRVVLDMDIRAVTGLRIGGAPAALAIGSLDNPVIRNPFNQQPYIPGSSLRGKMRSLWEKSTGAVQNFPIRRSNPAVYIHAPKYDDPADYETDAVCRVFGVTGDMPVPNPTRLVVHDAFLSDESVELLETVAQTDQPFTETKWEAAIDRITSAAVPRQMERVPAGAVFSDARLVFSLYGTLNPALDELTWFFDVLRMLRLVEEDYLGSGGARGSGRVRFENLRLSVRSTQDYGVMPEGFPLEAGFVQELLDQEAELISRIRAVIRLEP
jgi:CRISPR-associated protein Csm3